jgi:hypothetical protein
MRYEACIALICPFNPGALWWHTITPDGAYFHTYVKRCIPLPWGEDLLLAGAAGYQLTGTVPIWPVMALLMDFKRIARATSRHALPLPSIRDFH